MIRNGALYGMALLMAIVVGCTKSVEPPQEAQIARAGLMPAGDLGTESVYTADQKQVKLAAAREISYEPLDTFRGAESTRWRKRAPRNVSQEPRSTEESTDESPVPTDAGQDDPDDSDDDEAGTDDEDEDEEADLDDEDDDGEVDLEDEEEDEDDEDLDGEDEEDESEEDDDEEDQDEED